MCLRDTRSTPSTRLTSRLATTAEARLMIDISARLARLKLKLDASTENESGGED